MNESDRDLPGHDDAGAGAPGGHAARRTRAGFTGVEDDGATPGTVLLVDDEPGVTAALARAFHKEPWRILEARSGPEALRVMEREPVDVIISDEEMPGMSGGELLSEARRRFPEAVRMVLTGRARMDAVIRAINEGEIYRFLLKPCHEGDLRLNIRQALELKALRSENRTLSETVRVQRSLLQELERQNPGITRVERDADGAIVIDEE